MPAQLLFAMELPAKEKKECKDLMLELAERLTPKMGAGTGASASTSRNRGTQLPNKHRESTPAGVSHASISTTNLLNIEVGGRVYGPEQLRDLTNKGALASIMYPL